MTDFVSDAGQLFKSLLFRFRAHPVEIPDAFAHCIFNAPHHIERARLCLGAECFSDVDLPQGFAKIAVRVLHTPFPARLHVFDSPEVLAVEVEILLYEFGRQVR